jgi:radical SAM protein with 4Fe4S-binding SPASM domain
VSNCACGIILDKMEASGLRLFFLELTPVCNNACVGCGNVFAGDRSFQPLSAREWYVIIDKIAPWACFFEITGGEPTLHPEFREIIEYVETLGIPFNLLTNARWPEPDSVTSLLTRASCLNSLLVSLHGASAHSHEAFTGVPGSFAETVDNIKRAVDAGLSVTTSTVLTRQNRSEIESIVALGQELGARGAAFERYIGVPLPEWEPSAAALCEAVKVIDVLGDTYGHGVTVESSLPSIEHPSFDDKPVRFGVPIPHCFVPNSSNGCRAGTAQATIDPEGNVRPCNYAPVQCGNLLAQSLAQVWQSAVIEEWRRMIPDECLECLHFEECRGGCRAAAMMQGLTRDPLMSIADSVATPITTNC